MQLGICTTVENSPAVKAAGWDFVEERVDLLLQGLLPDAEWKGAERASQAVLPVPAANVLITGGLRITGPDVNADALRAYIASVMSRAAKIGIDTIVFGSGGARKVPDGFERATSQIIDFLKMMGPIAQQNGVTIVIEPLNRKETNIINSVAEAMEYVKAANHPAIQCLVDSYHFWLEDEPLKNLEAAMPWIKHVHVADKDGRVAPGLSGTADYKPFFRVLKQGGYDGRISVEAGKFAPETYAPVLKYVNDEWTNA